MTKFILLAPLLFLAACGTQGTINSELLERPISAKQSRLIIQRDNSMLYLAAAAEVSLNGQKIASLARNASVIKDSPSGKNTLSVHAPGTVGNYTASYDLKSGTTYIFEVGPNDNKSMMPGILFGYMGEAVDAQTSQNTGYFQILLKETK